MNLANLKVKEQVGLSDGSLAEVVEVSSDQSHVKVRYIDTMGQPELVGKEASIHSDEVLTVIQGTHAEGLA